MKTTIVSKIDRKRHTVDASGKSIGRLATHISTLLRGKHKVGYTPSVDNGDFVEVTNISAATFTGKKAGQKEYKHYTGYPGGLKTTKMEVIFEKKPGEVLRRSIYQMLPPNTLREAMIKRLIIKK